jgi:hypothetical protein
MAKLEIELRDGKELVITEKASHKSKHKFYAVGMEMMVDNKLESVAGVMKDLDSNAYWLLWSLIEIRNYSTNISVFSMANFDAALKARGVRGYKELRDKKLVVKVKRSHYMINPDFIKPDFNVYNDCKMVWEKLLGGSEE